MVIRSVLGYVLCGLGIVGVAAWAVPSVKTSIPYLSQISSAIGSDMTLLIVSIVLAAIGIFLALGSGGGRARRGAEVPIYQGKNVVGYRRH